MWKLSRKDKKNLMGRFRVDAGGPVDPGLAGTSKWKTKEEEPVWFYQKPYKLCESLCHAYYAKAIVDFSPASGQNGGDEEASSIRRDHLQRDAYTGTPKVPSCADEGREDGPKRPPL